MKNTHLNKLFSVLVSILYSTFLLFNFIYFIFNKTVINYFPEKSGILYWVTYICVILFITLFLLFSIMKLIPNIGRMERLFIPVILLTCIIPRVIWINIVNIVPTGDFSLYHQLAGGLVNGKLMFTDYITMFPHVLGYPTVLSVLYRIFGTEVYVAQYFNIFLSCGIVLLLYFLGKRLFNQSCGFIAAMIWSLWPSQVFYTSLVATEALFTFLALTCISLFIRITRKDRALIQGLLPTFVLGMLIAVSNEIRPLGPVLLAAVILYYLLAGNVHCISVKPWQSKLCFCLTIVVSYFVVSHTTGSLINHAVHDKIAKNPIGYNLFVGANFNYRGTWNPEDAETFTKYLKNSGLDAQQIHNQLLSAAIQRFKENGVHNITLFMDKYKTMWLTDDDSILYISRAMNKKVPSFLDPGQDKLKSVLILISNLYYYVILLIASLSGIMLIKSKDRSILILLFLIVLGIAGLHEFFEAAERYHYPVIVIFSLSAGYSLAKYTEL